MRLYDEIARFGLMPQSELMGKLQPEFWEMFRQATVVDVTNVQDYLRATKGISQEPFDMPSLAPPFPVTFYEFWTGHAGPLKGTRIGVLIAAWDRLKDKVGQWTAVPEWQRDVNDTWLYEGKRQICDARWKLWGMTVSMGGSFLPKNTISGPEASFSIEVADDGTVVRMGGKEPMAGANFGEGEQLGGPDDGRLFDLGDHRSMLDLVRVGDTSLGGEITLHKIRWGGLKFALLPCFFATSLMNCRNIEVLENVPGSKLSRAFQRRSGMPMTKYYTLVVGPIGTKASGSGGRKGSKIAKSLHICRGHFSTYTEDKPLFGKYTGRFWIPAHVRGAAEEGKVVKDYSVKAPKEQAA